MTCNSMGLFFSSPACSSSRKPFKVIIHEGELAQIRKWVKRHEEIETGGDLFGLWAEDNTVVVQFALGPGKGSRRTSVSFFQNSKYLGKAGKALTEDFGLCHIGEWHSHHRLGIPEPSGGDENTVRSNMPQYGWKRFVVFIANIGRDDSVGLGCFLFEAEDTTYWRPLEMLRGEFECLPKQSPLRLYALLDPSFKAEIEEGAESINELGEVKPEEKPGTKGYILTDTTEAPSTGLDKGRSPNQKDSLMDEFCERLKGHWTRTKKNKVVVEIDELTTQNEDRKCPASIEFFPAKNGYYKADVCYLKIPIMLPDDLVLRRDEASVDSAVEKIREAAQTVADEIFSQSAGETKV